MVSATSSEKTALDYHGIRKQTYYESFFILTDCKKDFLRDTLFSWSFVKMLCMGYLNIFLPIFMFRFCGQFANIL